MSALETGPLRRPDGGRSPLTLPTAAPGGIHLADAGMSAQDRLAQMVESSGLRRVLLLAWRDLDDPEAGGSEVHADKVAQRWAAAGLDITLRTAAAPGHPERTEREGYKVIRKAGRYAVFPRSAVSAAIGRSGRHDGLVEIWNGMPFMSPIWARCPRIVFLHHVHAEMWRMVLPPHLARIGETLELKLAPPVYRRTPIVTLSESSREEIISMLGMTCENITVSPPGISPRFSPGGERSLHPLVVAVGRLVPVKRVDLLVDALVKLREDVPNLEAVVVGEGYERPALEAQIAAAGAQDWLKLPGRISDDELIALYRRAWAVTSASAREGWGMTITEAAACATPAVVTRIAGHSDAVADGLSGVLVDQPADLSGALRRVFTDPTELARLQAGALSHSARFTWDNTALATFTVLAEQARRRGGATIEA
jgi:glycosyltransferase involved in cell wall biosynthesis